MNELHNRLSPHYREEILDHANGARPGSACVAMSTEAGSFGDAQLIASACPDGSPLDRPVVRRLRETKR